MDFRICTSWLFNDGRVGTSLHLLIHHESSLRNHEARKYNILLRIMYIMLNELFQSIYVNAELKMDMIF